MHHTEEKLQAIGVRLDDILLPSADTDMTRWSVVACDQYTSEPEYWKRAEAFIGEAPSTLRLIFPEVWLDRETEAQKEDRIAAINRTMDEYESRHLLCTHQGPILVERSTGSGDVRLGLIVAVDLGRYDYHSGSQSLIRATEGTIVDRLPPRIRIREHAAMELPHIMVLIDDPDKSVIEPLREAAHHESSVQDAAVAPVYDFPLMEGGGHLKGWKIGSEPLLASMAEALDKLADPRAFQTKYGVGPECGILLFAVGDGNHSLATAKSCWEQIRKTVPPGGQASHPARHALVELVNVHDEGLHFEPIHRILFGVDAGEWLQFFTGWHREHGIRTRVDQPDVNGSFDSGMPLTAGFQETVMIWKGGRLRLIWENPSSQLAVGSLQAFLDAWLETHPASTLDYVHGSEVTERLGAAPGNIGFLLPPMSKKELFPTVIRDGALPRKTFSMGEANDKRFYLECRRIR